LDKLKPRFLSVDNHDTLIDYHVHSNYNDDAQGTVEECVRSAFAKGLTSIAITNHVWKTSSWIDNFVNEVKRVRARRGYHLLVGFEAKVINIDGEIDIATNYINEGELVLGALHHLPTKDDYVWLSDENLPSPRAAEIIRDATLSMISRGEVNVIAHPLALYHPRYAEPFPSNFLEELVYAASKRGVALEIHNSKHLLSQNPFMRLVTLCVKHKALMSIGSDAHNPSEIGDMNYKEILMTIQQQASGNREK